ncbi:MAG: hypothetical protein KGZ90_05715 [Algoriphagus sp.]|nr:hypothetical protein [Algoriphagus sp.]
MRKFLFLVLSTIFYLPNSFAQFPQVSGVYPHLAQFNQEGECGTGAVVFWAGKLWTISYGPHLPFGSSDRLYEINPDLSRTVRPESVGGTHANRMIHRESNQLFIGNHVIDSKGNVRTINPLQMPGRLTGMARSLTDPANKILYATMEKGFYEVDVHTLEVTMLFKDGNQIRKEAGGGTHESTLLPGVHGKGFYSGQGVYVYSNNGESGAKALVDPTIEAGSLSEWNGKEWKLIRRMQFVEVTGPGGIYGNQNPDSDPIWATGWDNRSAMVGVRANGTWSFYRVPKASNSYDGAHGWNTEWPRIRNVGSIREKDYLMTLHGMFWRFPEGFSPQTSAGLRPRSSYLKIIGDFERWGDQLVFGTDDATKSEFLSNRPDKAGIPGAGQSQSNLWFTDLSMPDRLGPIDATGSIYLRDSVSAATPSEPFLFAGWKNRTAWIKNHSNQPVSLIIEVDEQGDGKWKVLKTVELAPASGSSLVFSPTERGEWIRVKTTTDAVLSFSLSYSDPKNKNQENPSLFDGFKSATEDRPEGSVMYALGKHRRLGILSESGNYYEMDSLLQIKSVANDSLRQWMSQTLSIPKPLIRVEGNSYLVTDANGGTWRLPLGESIYTDLMEKQQIRLVREVVTERDLLHLGGTFFELPAENAGGYAKIKPISTHSLLMQDVASYRGMLLISGADPSYSGDHAHILKSEDGKIALWAGVVDDLWKLGKPKGKGGPWNQSQVAEGDISDPYLFGGYDQRSLTLVNHGIEKLAIRVEIDPTGSGDWFGYQTIEVLPGKTFDHAFPESITGKWVRFFALGSGHVSTELTYE